MSIPTYLPRPLRARGFVSLMLFVMLLGLAAPACAQGRGRRGGGFNDRDLQELLAPVIEEARRSAVTIVGDGEERGLGTIVDARGYILAKASEVVGFEELTCETADDETYVARVVGRDNANDLVMLHIEAEGLVPVRFAEEDTLIGEWVIAAGPEARPRQVGIISARARKIAPNRLVLGVMLSPDGEGLVVTDLTEGYGAADAGVRVGDLITHVMGNKVVAIQQVVGALQDRAIGDTITVEIVRDGREVELEVELRENQPDENSRGERMNRMGGEVSDRNVGFEMVLQHDAEIRPVDCGGPLVNLEGEVVGINIARAGRIATYALPASLLSEKVERMIARDTAPADAEVPEHEPVTAE